MKLGPKFLKSLFEVTHVEFQTYDLFRHRVLFSSGVVSKLLGYSPKEYAGLSDGFYKTLIHPDDLPIVQQTIDKILEAKKGDVFEMTIRFRKTDDTYIWLYSRQMVYEKDADTNKFTIIREVEDVTELVHLQQELERKVAQLNLVAFNNSHLLRSPVASIIGLVDLIEEHAVMGDHNKQVLHFLKVTIKKLDEVVLQINEAAYSNK